jgi:hypothetical protein
VSTSKYRAAISEEERMAELFKASRPKEAQQDAAG